MQLTTKNLEQVLVEINKHQKERAFAIHLSPTEIIIPQNVVDAFHWFVEIGDPEKEHYRIRGGE